MSGEYADIKQRNQNEGSGHFLKWSASVFFVLAVISISVLFFLRRDILVYKDRYGYLGVLLLCFLCNATVFAPAPSLLVVLAATQSLNPLAVILLGALGTTLGEMVGYLSGIAGRNLAIKPKDGRTAMKAKCMAEKENPELSAADDGGVAARYEMTGKKEQIILWISQHGTLAIFLFALLPLPLFDLAGVASGYMRMKWPLFLMACFVGKLLKMVLCVLLGVYLKNILGIAIPFT